MSLRVGFAQRDMTPPLGLPLGGYAARSNVADAVLDPLLCHAAIFDDGVAPIALVVLDLVHVLGKWVEAVRTRAAQTLNLQPERLLVSATHTHAGPGVFRSSVAPAERFAAYERELVDGVASCLAAAKRTATDALLRAGSAAAPGVAANRRDPSLPIDDEVRVLCAGTPGGQLLGVVANFACHPTVLSAANTAYSADLLGIAATYAAAALGAPVLFTNGAAGDVSTRFTRRAQTYAELQRLSRFLATAVCSAVRSATPISDAPLAAAVSSVSVRWRPLPAPEAAARALHAAMSNLDRVRARADEPAAIRLAQSRVEGAQAELWLTSHGGWEALFGTRPPLARLQALRCGDVAIVAAPGELFASAGDWLRARIGEHALVVGYANDYIGYFIPAAGARDGGYEALIAMVHPACEATIRTGLLGVAQAAGCNVIFPES